MMSSSSQSELDITKIENQKPKKKPTALLKKIPQLIYNQSCPCVDRSFFILVLN